METATINLFYVFQTIIVVLAIFGGHSLLTNLMEKIKDIYNKKKDAEITALALSRENCTEIHKLNERLSELEERLNNAYQ